MQNAIVLKGNGSIIIVEIIHHLYGEEALTRCIHFKLASHLVSSGPWVPMTPDSQDINDLDEQWDKHHEEDYDNSVQTSSRRLD